MRRCEIIAQGGPLPKTRYSGHHFSRLSRGASMHSHPESLAYCMGRNSREHGLWAKTMGLLGLGGIIGLLGAITAAGLWALHMRVCPCFLLFLVGSIVCFNPLGVTPVAGCWLGCCSGYSPVNRHAQQAGVWGVYCLSDSLQRGTRAPLRRELGLSPQSGGQPEFLKKREFRVERGEGGWQ